MALYTVEIIRHEARSYVIEAPTEDKAAAQAAQLAEETTPEGWVCALADVQGAALMGEGYDPDNDDIATGYLVLSFRLSGDELGDGHPDAVARLVADAAARIRAGHGSFGVRDGNGNTVGRCEIVPSGVNGVSR